MKINYLAIIAIAFFTFSSCVSMDKYKALEDVKAFLEQENESLKNARDENRQLSTQLRQAQQDLNQKEQELVELRTSFNSLDRNYKDLANRYNELISQNRDIVTITSSEKELLTQELARKQLLLDQKEKELRNLELGLSEREQKVTDLKRMLDAKDAQMRQIRERLNAALRGFTAEDLTVSEKDGKIYVSLSQNLLFRSGSYRIDPKGIQAIRRLAQVLNENQDIDINIEGHTDTDGTADANWDLSVRRATSVVKELINSGVPASRLVASGRGQHFPVAANSTSAGKAQNRRTEIILSPKLEVLYEIIK